MNYFEIENVHNQVVILLFPSKYKIDGRPFFSYLRKIFYKLKGKREISAINVFNKKYSVSLDKILEDGYESAIYIKDCTNVDLYISSWNEEHKRMIYMPM